MLAPLNPEWTSILKNEMEQPYFKDLSAFVEEQYKKHQCFPPKERIFAALNNCSFDDIKVVIIGQDPYHKPHLANGLCFSVNSGMPIPASLQNIYKEIQEDLGVQTPSHGNLIQWAKQGVLLLNATLTVQVHKAGSHQKKGWEQFTDAIINIISTKKEGVVFMLWGGYAKKKGAKVASEKHLILQSGHPSPLSANRGLWFGNKHFSQCNTYLKTRKKSKIDWV
ncbi:uracil-DNA glycosylase [Aquimarina agarivorans]|uniref:uracil-DNA glycosylase n=1 Tax=Aquimarina agarivorans TaxID=980584 RepID=UPI000248E7BC|nr:uracil-DNA glycosylase [Aquimarina agarivorans]